MTAIPAGSREELETLERKHADNPEGRYFVPLANAYRKNGDLDGAIALLRAGLERHPDYLSAHIVLGRCFVDRGEASGAEAEFRYVLSLDPQNLIALRTLGELAASTGKAEEARSWYEDLLAVDPMNEDARRSLEAIEARVGSVPPEAPNDAASLPEVPEQEEESVVAPDLPASATLSPTTGYEPQYGTMVDFGGEQEGEPTFPDEGDAVVTETIAELYTRQGFYQRAADVYRELIRRRGGDSALEARLRSVEALAAGAAAATPVPPSAPAMPAFGATPSYLEEPFASPTVREDLPLALPDLEELDAEYEKDEVFPLIGPEGGAAFDAAPADPAEISSTQSGLPPAYDFASFRSLDDEAEEERDDLSDLHLEPQGDAGGDAGGWGTDTFADSFSAGFPQLDETTFAEPAFEAAPTTQPSFGARGAGTIRDYLREVAGWVPGAGKPVAAEDKVGLIELPSADAAARPAVPLLETTHVDPSPIEVEPPIAHASEAFDAPPVPTQEHRSEFVSDASPAGGFGAPDDGIRVLGGTADLFPWEIPVPDDAPGQQAAPMELDAGYPFGDVLPGLEGPAGGTLYAEGELPDLEISYPEAPPTPSEPAPASAAPEAAPPAPAAPAPEDDDLESFQTWLRSLKR